jgi:hypothetical protein
MSEAKMKDFAKEYSTVKARLRLRGGLHRENQRLI